MSEDKHPIETMPELYAVKTEGPSITKHVVLKGKVPDAEGHIFSRRCLINLAAKHNKRGFPITSQLPDGTFQKVGEVLKMKVDAASNLVITASIVEDILKPLFDSGSATLSASIGIKGMKTRGTEGKARIDVNSAEILQIKTCPADHTPLTPEQQEQMESMFKEKAGVDVAEMFDENGQLKETLTAPVKH